MTLNEKNMAGDHLVVGSLEVLGGLKNNGITEIRHNVNMIQQQTEQIAKQQKMDWENLSSDGVITPLEKTQLLKEYRSIQNSYSAIFVQATSLGKENSQLMRDFLATFEALHDYLYTTLKLFDNMDANTVLDDRDTFNSKFSNYYYAENFVLIALSEGILETINIRVLTSLTEEGTENEVGIYKGGIYSYVNGVWKNVSTGSYRGMLDLLPEPVEGSFFLASDDFNVYDQLCTHLLEPISANGDGLYVVRHFGRGYIFFYEDGVWECEYDKSNYRYVVAFSDYINLTGELPQIFQDAIAAVQESVNTVDANWRQSLADEIEARTGQYTVINNNIIRIDNETAAIVERLNADEVTISNAVTHLPEYLGKQDSDPQDAQSGDYYVYSGTTTASRTKAHIYRKTRQAAPNNWEELDSTVAENSSYYMLALDDILSLTKNLSNAYFASVFCQNIIGHKATLDNLAVQEINLRQNGLIKSDSLSYEFQRRGFCINANGRIDANGDVHIGATTADGSRPATKVAIGVPLWNNNGTYKSDFNNYDVVIGGRTLIGADTTIRGNLDGVGGTFTGAIECSGISINNIQPGNVLFLSFSMSGDQAYRIKVNIPAEGYFKLEYDVVEVFSGVTEHKSFNIHITPDLTLTLYRYFNSSSRVVSLRTEYYVKTEETVYDSDSGYDKLWSLQNITLSCSASNVFLKLVSTVKHITGRDAEID